MTNISQELLHIGFCNLVQMLWIIFCFMGKRTRFLLLILISFFFLSSFQISKNFISLSSGTERHTNLKLDTWAKGWSIVDTKNQTARIYLFLYFSPIFLSLSLAKIKNLLLQIVSTYLWWLRPGVCELCSLSAILKFGTNVGYTLLYCVRETRPPPAFHSLYLSFFLSLQ